MGGFHRVKRTQFPRIYTRYNAEPALAINPKGEFWFNQAACAAMALKDGDSLEAFWDSDGRRLAFNPVHGVRDDTYPLRKSGSGVMRFMSRGFAEYVGLGRPPTVRFALTYHEATRYWVADLTKPMPGRQSPKKAA